MNRRIVPPDSDLSQGVAELNSDDIPTEVLTVAELNSDDIPTEVLTVPEVSEARKQPRPHRGRKSRSGGFNSEWHDAKEIVVPFDESSFAGLLVDEKTFQAAYVPKRPLPQAGDSRLENKWIVGHELGTSDAWDDLACFSKGGLFFVEILLLVWTAALLLSGFPVSKWLAWTGVSVWTLALITLKLGMARPALYRGFLWCGACGTTLAWLVWSPWSGEFSAKISGYFFRT